MTAGVCSGDCPTRCRGFATIRWRCMGETLPPEIEVTATSDSGVVMGLRHKEYPIEGIQFHPESIMTECGKDILRNFLEG